MLLFVVCVVIVGGVTVPCSHIRSKSSFVACVQGHVYIQELNPSDRGVCVYVHISLVQNVSEKEDCVMVPSGMRYFSPLPACRRIRKALCTARSKSVLQFHFSTELN